MRRFFHDDYIKIVEANWPKNTWYVRGRRFEWTCGKHMKANGFPHVVRSTFSRGVADLTAVGKDGSLLIQCKRGGYMRPEEHDELWRAAQECGGTPILAGMPDGRNKRFWILTGPIYEEIDGERVRVAPRNKRPLREITFPLAADELGNAA
jgi:Holliday junction resolvase